MGRPVLTNLLASCVMACVLVSCGQTSTVRPSSSLKSYKVSVYTLRAPAALCEPLHTPAPARAPKTSNIYDDYSDDMVYVDELLEDAQMDLEGSVSLVSEGAPLGYVMAELAETARIPIVIRGEGASTPVFAFY